MGEPELLDEKQLLRRAQQAFARKDRTGFPGVGLEPVFGVACAPRSGVEHAAVQARVVDP